jgi:mannosyltransferase
MERPTGAMGSVGERRGGDTAWGRIAGVLLLATLLLALTLRLWGLDARGLWQDEIFTAAIASAENTLPEVISIPLYNTALPAPPLYFLVTHAFLHVGDNDFLLRFPALVLGVLGVAATYTVGARLFGRVEGVVGALLLAAAPLHLRYSQDARFYTLQVLLSLLSAYFLYRAVLSTERKWYVGFAVCSILNLYNHLFAFFVLAAEVAFVAGLWAAGAVARARARQGAGGRERASEASLDGRGTLAFVSSLTIIALAYTPMLPHLWRGLGGAKGLGDVGSGLTLNTALVSQALDSWGLGSGWRILILLVPFLVGLIASARDGRRALWLGCCWLVVPLVILVVLPAGHNFRPRYVLFLLPMYLVFAARGLTAIVSFLGQRWAGPKWRSQAMGLGVLLAGIGVMSVPAVQGYYEEDRVHWRGVSALVAGLALPGDVIVSPGAFPQVVMPRYEESLEHAVFVIGGSEVFLSPQEERAPGVWFVGPAREKMQAVDAELSQALGSFFKVVFDVNDQTAARGRALKIAPVMYDDIWVIHVQEGQRPEDVIERYEKALGLVSPPVASSIHVTLGDFYRAEDRLDEAVVEYEEAASLDPRAPEPHQGLALVYEARGLREQYEQEWQLYEELSVAR